MSAPPLVHDTMPVTHEDARAYQQFILGMKLYWSDSMYRSVVTDAQRIDAQDPQQLEGEMVRSSETYRFFGWLEHYLQQYKYYGKHGLLTIVGPQKEELAEALEKGARVHPERLRLKPDLSLPTYYTSVDFHQHPGGVWSDDHDAFVYEYGARSTTPMLGDDADLHTRYARYVRDLCAPESILDAGCGFGKTTIPMKTENPGAKVFGSDLSAPCLKLAHLRSLQQELEIEYVQCASEDLDVSSDTFDAVTGSMLIHEMPQKAVAQSVAEAFRVLKPGGWLVYLDFYDIPGGVVGEFFHRGHSARNEEPFMTTLLAMDMNQELDSAGFEGIRVEKFEEAAGALDNGDGLPAKWRFPWTIIAGRKPNVGKQRTI